MGTGKLFGQSNGGGYPVIGLHPIQENVNASKRLMPWKSELIAGVISHLGLKTPKLFYCFVVSLNVPSELGLLAEGPAAPCESED